jgi:molybdopterin converting factor small subunit
MARVRLHGALPKVVDGRAELTVDGATVREVLRAIERAEPALHGWILDERGRIRRHLHVFVGGDGGREDTPVGPEERIDVLPAISGG